MCHARSSPGSLHPRHPLIYMKGLPTLLAAILAASAASPPALLSQDPSQLVTEVQKLFSAKCGECHKAGAPQEESPHLVDDLASLDTADFINKAKPEESKLYDMLLRGKMPKTTRAEKAEGQRATPLSPDETQLVLTWMKAGVPQPAAPLAPGTPETTTNTAATASTTLSVTVTDAPSGASLSGRITVLRSTQPTFGPASPPPAQAAPPQPQDSPADRQSAARPSHARHRGPGPRRCAGGSAPPACRGSRGHPLSLPPSAA